MEATVINLIRNSFQSCRPKTSNFYYCISFLVKNNAALFFQIGSVDAYKITAMKQCILESNAQNDNDCKYSNVIEIFVPMILSFIFICRALNQYDFEKYIVRTNLLIHMNHQLNQSIKFV